MSTGRSNTAGFPTSHFRVGAFERRLYPKAPIIEAIISLSVELPKKYGIEAFRSFCELDPSYTEDAEERMFSISMQPGEVAPQQKGEISGLRFVSSDRRYICVCRETSFAVSRLAPYEDWEKFRTEARRLWELYATRFSPVKVTGLSVRYINRIEIPWTEAQQVDFRWYFRTFPEVSTDLDVGMAGFHMRLDMPLASIGARLILNQAMLPPASPSPASISVLFDSDIVSSLDALEEGTMWERLEVLRTAKNDVFESCITNLTRELFK